MAFWLGVGVLTAIILGWIVTACWMAVLDVIDFIRENRRRWG